MPAAPVPPTEPARLADLHRYGLLDTPPEPGFDDLAAVAAHVCQTPIALVVFLDADRQWFKARVGLRLAEAPRDQAFCAHAILSDRPLVVPDTRSDARFAANPLVTGDPHVRFYAGVPLVTPRRQPVGTLCVIDRRPRGLDAIQMAVLAALARQVVGQMELRRLTVAQSAGPARAAGLLAVCAWCKRVRDDAGAWERMEAHLRRLAGKALTHGMCPDCFASKAAGE